MSKASNFLIKGTCLSFCIANKFERDETYNGNTISRCKVWLITKEITFSGSVYGTTL